MIGLFRSTGALIGLALVALACESPSSSDLGRTVETKSAITGGRTTEAKAKHGFVGDIERITEDNRDFRRVVYTGAHLQLVAMSIAPHDHIGLEQHDVDQFFRVESGKGEVVIDQTRSPVGPGSAIVIPAGARHDLLNVGDAPLQVYTVYAPPQHRDGVVHRTRADAERDQEHFDGRTSE